MPRSGTNFVWHLLLQHPTCHPGSVGEDFLLTYSHLLKLYSENLFKQWNSRWQERLGKTPDIILSKIGGSLISLIERPYYLYPDGKSADTDDPENKDEIGEKRLVTKTPNVDNLDLFYKLFPNAYLIIIIRDGRSVVESGMKSFGWSFEEATRRWNRAANAILGFDKAQQEGNKRHLILKYEKLLKDTESEVKKMLSFVRLGCDEYDFDKVKTLPVYGSSEMLDSNAAINWAPSKKTETFDPARRWYRWNDEMHSRFNWIAGKAMVEFDYSLHRGQKDGIRSRALNVWLDKKYWLHEYLHELSRFLLNPKRNDS